MKKQKYLYFKYFSFIYFDNLRHSFDKAVILYQIMKITIIYWTMNFNSRLKIQFNFFLKKWNKEKTISGYVTGFSIRLDHIGLKNTPNLNPYTPPNCLSSKWTNTWCYSCDTRVAIQSWKIDQNWYHASELHDRILARHWTPRSLTTTHQCATYMLSRPLMSITAWIQYVSMCVTISTSPQLRSIT